MNHAREQLRRRIDAHLEFIYPELSEGETRLLRQRIMELMRLDEYIAHPEPHHNPWTQHDAIVITYGDTILEDDKQPLRTLREFLRQEFSGYVSGVHVLPFFPWSSDDGFAVMEYLSVNESLGSWDEISAIGRDFLLMADLVINHCSSNSRWFDNFKRRIDPGKDYFLEEDPRTLLHEVVRPRISPLLRATETADGIRHVWCTFSHDQVDLNFRNTDVLLEFVRIVRFYLDRNIKMFRLDAVAFLWKEVDTRCINLPQTHEIVRLLRTLIEHYDPEAVIVTETNIPNHENLSYFGNGNEAHSIYSFSLPPLLLYTLVSGNCSSLLNWLTAMPPAQAGTAYLNFIASHDGIGLRPAEGLLSDSEIDRLAGLMQEFGGKISWRSVGKDAHRPYEINIALYDAFKGTLKTDNHSEGDHDLESSKQHEQFQRFICAHTIMLALEGIPAIYIHSFFGTQNDYQRVEQSGQNRSINRRQWPLTDLHTALMDEQKHHKFVFERLRQLLAIRRYQPAFHPNASQFALQLGDQIFGFWRQSLDREQSIFCLHNVSDRPQTVPLLAINISESDGWHDLLSDMVLHDLKGDLNLAPYQCVWLTNWPSVH